MFASKEAAEHWFAQHDPEGVAFEVSGFGGGFAFTTVSHRRLDADLPRSRRGPGACLRNATGPLIGRPAPRQFPEVIVE